MFLLLFIYLAMPTLAYPHAQSIPRTFGFFEGMMHPIVGLDHLLAMLCVGMISSRIGGKAIWQVPTCFVVVMTLGCLIGFFDTTAPLIEPLISLSVIVFGALFLFPKWLTMPATFITVAIFALAHGIAHGKEMPIFVLPEIYIAGFMIATIGIHIFGVGIGELMNKLPKAILITQITGGLLVIAGSVLLMSAL